MWVLALLLICVAAICVVIVYDIWYQSSFWITVQTEPKLASIFIPLSSTKRRLPKPLLTLVNAAHLRRYTKHVTWMSWCCSLPGCSFPTDSARWLQPSTCVSACVCASDGCACVCILAELPSACAGLCMVWQGCQQVCVHGYGAVSLWWDEHTR